MHAALSPLHPGRDSYDNFGGRQHVLECGIIHSKCGNMTTGMYWQATEHFRGWHGTSEGGMTHSEGDTTPSKGRYDHDDSCRCTIFTEGGIILLRDV